MAATITLLSNPASGRISIGSRTMILAELAGDASYPTGGYPVTAGQFGLSRIDEIFVLASQGYIGKFVESTGNVILYTPGAAGSAVFTGSALATHTHVIAPTIKEAVTVTTNAGTLAAVPGEISMIYANTATAVGPKVIIPDGVAPAAGQVAVNFTTGGLVFNATDAVTAAQVTYTKAATANTAISAGTPAGTVAIAASAGGEVANGTNLSTLTNVSLIAIGI